MAIRVKAESQTLDALPGQSLFECADAVALPITNSCGQKGNCRECLVEVTEGADLLTTRTEQEHHLRGDFRLACRARLREGQGTVSFRRLRWSGVRIVDAGLDLPVAVQDSPFDPAVRRDGDTVLLDGEAIARTTVPICGLAVDVGTTTVVVRLVDLERGEIRATQSFENPQRFAGSDVMARIAFAPEDHEDRLQKTLAAYVNQAIGSFACDHESIYEVVVVGNTTMRDLFFGLDVQSIGQSPYLSLTEHDLLAGRRTTTSLTAQARNLGLRTHKSARAYGLPLISSHVGADAAACLLAIDALNEERVIALVDIGTNTELLVGNRHRMLAASCPAGPAFEGSGISCGMPAFPGAIEAVRIDAQGTAHIEVIGDEEPQGVCGSGLLDTLAELSKAGRMNEFGRIGADRFDIDEENHIYIEEGDISSLAQAKGALGAGWSLVMKGYGVAYSDLERLYLAGGFGYHIDIDAALRIGLVPALPAERFQQLGNAAIEGATLALRSVTLRQQIESFVKGIEHVELETDEDFFDAFVEGCQFKPLGETYRLRG